ncbi:MAG: hypothetical protein WEE03_06935 [Chloroflexota bacterium]
MRIPATLMAGGFALALLASAAAAAVADERPAGLMASRPEPAAAVRSQPATNTGPVTLTGQVGTTTAADGDVEYTITADGQTISIDAGPSWYHDVHPLAAFVGETVTITGEMGSGPPASVSKAPSASRGPELDVFTITLRGQTTTLRVDGRPGWAGGPQAVGAKHPAHGKAPSR